MPVHKLARRRYAALSQADLMAYSLDDSWDNCGPVARAGNACFGLYVRCGIWSARNLTDGFVPVEIATGYGSPEQAQKLVAVGLWEIADGGYLASDYLTRNPSADAVRARQKAEADRKARWRASRQDGRGSPASRPGGTPRGTPRSPTTPKGVGRAREALRADWCGYCHKDNRTHIDERDRSVPCPNCHPNREAS